MQHLATGQRKALQKALRDNQPIEEVVQQFLEQYFFLESLVRMVGKYYKSRNGQATVHGSHDVLNLAVVSRSIKYFGGPVSDSTLDSVFDSSLRIRGKRSARNLRNAIVHNWSKEDQREVLARSEVLLVAINDLIEVIQKISKRA